jgi:hypothetical protein
VCTLALRLVWSSWNGILATLDSAVLELVVHLEEEVKLFDATATDVQIVLLLVLLVLVLKVIFCSVLIEVVA